MAAAFADFAFAPSAVIARRIRKREGRGREVADVRRSSSFDGVVIFLLMVARRISYVEAALALSSYKVPLYLLLGYLSDKMTFFIRHTHKKRDAYQRSTSRYQTYFLIMKYSRE